MKVASLLESLPLHIVLFSMNLPKYGAPFWLRGAHLQTIWPVFLQRRPVAWQREQWHTPDGDVIAVDALPGLADKPVVVLFHGLEGSSRSHYATSLAHELARHGWGMVLPHFRSCGGLANRLPRAYFAGDSAEIGWMLAQAQKKHPDQKLFAAGVSLGGNALLKWLGEQGDDAGKLVCAAAGLSAPVDLSASGRVLRQGFNRQVYTRYFLKTLIPKTLAKLRLHPELAAQISERQLRSVKDLHDFDDLFTAPVHGFINGRDYWVRASSKPWLKHITVPTLLLNALNDPFVPAESLPGETDVSAKVTLLQPEQGGHVGFACGTFPGRENWLPRTLFHFFASKFEHGEH